MQTLDNILEVLQEDAENKTPVDPAFYLEAAMKMLALVGNVSDELYVAESTLAKVKVQFIEEGDTVAKAKAKVEAMELYPTSRRLKAKIERVYEMVRLAKLRSRMANDEFKSN